MSHVIDLTGKIIGRWTVLHRVENNSRGHTQWLCRCSCEDKTEKVVIGIVLRDKRSQSCGCKKEEYVGEGNPNYRHGHATAGITKTYYAWSSMLSRCHNPKNNHYHLYGGRGIIVCERWHIFANFLEDMGEAPEDSSLDRINNNDIYKPGNCRWATDIQQANNRRNNRLVTMNGITKTITQWTDYLKISPGTVYSRLYRGWDIIDALTKSVQKKTKRA